MKSIVFIGECMIEDHADGIFRFGGDTLNTALYLARVSDPNEVQVAYATALGTDFESNLLVSEWSKENIDTKYVTQLVDLLPGRYIIQTDSKGERRFRYKRENSAARHYFKSNPGALFKCLENKLADYVYLSGISLAILSKSDQKLLFSLLETFKQQGGVIIFDNNYRPTLWEKNSVIDNYIRAMELADIALLTDEDEFEIYNDPTLAGIIDRAKQFNVTETIIKRGSKSCMILNSVGVTEVPAEQLSSALIVDTCAAGDAFAAGFLARRLSGDKPDAACLFGHKLAARVIQFSGAIINKKSMADLSSH